MNNEKEMGTETDEFSCLYINMSFSKFRTFRETTSPKFNFYAE